MSRGLDLVAARDVRVDGTHDDTGMHVDQPKTGDRNTDAGNDDDAFIENTIEHFHDTWRLPRRPGKSLGRTTVTPHVRREIATDAPLADASRGTRMEDLHSRRIQSRPHENTCVGVSSTMVESDGDSAASREYCAYFS